MSVPTAEEILQKHVPNRYSKNNSWKEAMIEFAKLHVEAALKEAVKCLPYDDKMNQSLLDARAILNSYPLDKIK